MKSKNTSKSIIMFGGIVILILNFHTHAFGWGKDGHQIVARIASKLLTPRAKTQVNALLAQGETLESVALWADGLRGSNSNPGVRPETPLWHFVDIPLAKNDYEASRDCAETPNGSCAVSALVFFQEVLSQKKKGYYNENFNRYEALKFIVHFTGDIHQPLHCIDDNDAGGNLKKVFWLDDTTERNLHGVWDGEILTKNMQTANIATAELYADKLFNSLTPAEKDLAAPPVSTLPSMVCRETIISWAEAAHAIAKSAYADLGTKDATNHYHLKKKYYDDYQDDVDAQLKKAGIRLALILNDNLR